jgi:S-adenosyl methyltransferase
VTSQPGQAELHSPDGRHWQAMMTSAKTATMQRADSSSRLPSPQFRWQGNGSAPNIARIYNVLLGGSTNLAADQAAAAELLRWVPDVVMAAYRNRAFVRRAVEFLGAMAGIRQFIDVGSGLPTQFAVHKVAQEVAPHARVLYVDHDPFVVSHLQEVLAESQTAGAISHDLRDPCGIIRHPALTRLINLDEPVAIITASVLHFIHDAEDPAGIVGCFKEALASGSYLALSHATADELPAGAMRGMHVLRAAANAPIVPRTRRQITGFLDGLDITPPGLVNGSAWRPGFRAAEPRRTLFYAAVARKR